MGPQKRITKESDGFHNHSNLLTMFETGPQVSVTKIFYCVFVNYMMQAVDICKYAANEIV